MGYSPQKTPFDLTDFLSKPGSPKSRNKWKRFSLGARPAAEPEKAEAEVAAPEVATKA
ncbi:MAG: hypothetical protein ACK4GC_14545 [Paracoccaceae bacterium]